MQGLIIAPRAEYETAAGPLLESTQAVRIFRHGAQETLMYRMESGSVGTFEVIQGQECNEVYHILQGALELRPLGEAPRVLRAGDFFMLDNTSICLPFSVPEACRFVCYTTHSYYERDLQYTTQLERVMHELQQQDGDTAAHCARVKNLAMAVAEQLCYHGNMNNLLHAARFHDIGKARIPLHILIKPGKLTDAEFAVMKRHSIYSADMLRGHFDDEVITVLRQHHERPDGSGYPDGISGGQILDATRIIAVADAYDAMVTARPYNKGVPAEAALRELQRCAGTQFDPDCVEAICLYMQKHQSDPNGDPWMK